MSHALLIGNGETLAADFLQECAQRADFVLAADGGADKALAAGVTPDAVIGDLDSVSPAAKARLADKLIFVNNQNNTDLEKALDWLVQNRFHSCDMCGFSGGRLDFTLGNFLSVSPYLEALKIAFRAPRWTVYPLTRGGVFPARPGARVSLIPVTQCSNVTLRGLQFPLEHAGLTPGRAGRTLSNRAVQDAFEVRLDGGFLLLYIEAA